MGQQHQLLAFNRGTVSRLALARLDIARLAMSAEVQTNWMPRALGSMMLRPGLGYIAGESGETHLLEFVFAADDAALIELHDQTLTIVKDDVRLTRPAVTFPIVNGAFALSLAGWATYGIAATWVTGGGVKLVGNGASSSDVHQTVAVTSPGTEHGLKVTVTRGTVKLRVSYDLLGGSHLVESSLGVGVHSIGFTPAADVQIGLFNQSSAAAIVASVVVESGDVVLPTPWTAADLRFVREYQSGDVVFAACRGRQQRRIVRTSARSWSVEVYAPTDGPFRIENVTNTTLTASAITGDITLTASGGTSNGLFKPTHVGALFRLSSVGQAVTSTFTADNQFSNSIRVIGVGAARNFSIVLTGTFTATVTLQYSTDNATWVDRTTYTAATSTSLTDGLDNQIIYYRLGVKTGGYTSGSAVANLSFAAGSITGVVRVTAYTDQSTVSATVVKDLGGTTATEVWAEGDWSDYRGWPSAVTILDGRLWWAGKDRFWGSVVDAYNNFDPDYEGDAGPVSRSIGFGPVDVINWLLPMDRLMAGTAGSELTCQSSAFDEPLTPTNFTPKESSTQGSADVQAIKIDDKAIFVQRCGTRVYEMAASSANGKFTPEDLTAINPDACSPGVVYMSAQRQPDTRVHFVLADGTVAVLLFDKAENLICWVKVETDGVIEDVAVLPGEEEDAVYYVVRRTVGGSQVRHLEKWALEEEARGAAVNKIGDSFVYSAAAASYIDGLNHLEGLDVVAWGGGVELGTHTVSGGRILLPQVPPSDDAMLLETEGGYPIEGGSGQIEYEGAHWFSSGVLLVSLSDEGGIVITTEAGEEIDLEGDITAPGYVYTHRCAGLPYEASFMSSKLAYLVPPGKSPLAAKKKVNGLGLVLADTHAKGLEFGPDFEAMDPLPDVESYKTVGNNTIRTAYEEDLIEFPGEWLTDARLCLRATAPRPCTVLAAVIDMDIRTK